ncbi:MAG TPA: hypothetical protein VGJ06_16405, partial [Candidatus Acidoferrum sp.]
MNGSVEGTNSAQVSATPSNLPAPTGLTASSGNAQVGLRWTPTTGATVYHLKRSTVSGGPYAEIAAPTWYGYTDVGVKNGTTYYFVVSVVTSAGESTNSAQASVTPTAPASPTVTSVSVSPETASSITSGTLPFTASVAGTTTNKTVAWKAALGTVSASGMYKAPTTAGTDTVTATSVADPTKSDSVSVKVTIAPPPPPPSNPPPPTSTPSNGLAEGFFSLTYTSIAASHYPSVPFGSVRLWDTNTTWAQIETSRGNYNWTDLDVWLKNIHS